MYKDLESYFNLESLSDIDVTNPASNVTYKCHKVILAAACDLFAELFIDKDPKIITKFTIPRFIPTKSNLIDDPFPKVMLYVYSNQNFEKIRLDIDENNVSNIYSFAYSLKIFKLKADLMKIIVDNFLNKDSCCGFYLDAIKFENEQLRQKSMEVINQHFSEIATSKLGSEFINDLPFENFIEIIESPDLNVGAEIEVVKIIDRYLNHRRALPLLEEEDPAFDYTHLNEEEKKKREEVKAKGEEEKKAKEVEEQKKLDDEMNGKDDLGKIQLTVDRKQNAILKRMEQTFQVKRLTKMQKEQLFKAIRYSYLKHEELIELSFNPNFEQARSYIMQGLSYRLEPFEKSSFTEYTINLNPRKNYGQEMERQLQENYAQNRLASYDKQKMAMMGGPQGAMGKQQLGGGAQQQQQMRTLGGPQQLGAGYGQHQQQMSPNTNPNFQKMALDQQKQLYSIGSPTQMQSQPWQEYTSPGPNDPQKYDAFMSQVRLQAQGRPEMDVGGAMAASKYQFNQTAPSVLDPRMQKQQVLMQTMPNAGMTKGDFQRSQSPPFSSTMNVKGYTGGPAGGIVPGHFIQPGQVGSMLGQTMPYQATGGLGGGLSYPKAPQKEMYNIHAQTTITPKKQTLQPYTTSSKHQLPPPVFGTQLNQELQGFHGASGPGGSNIEFVYEFDFDENGVFYYLGTYGKKRTWQNPHALGLVHCFASSIGSGKVDDFIGRQVVNCRTMNEPFSFFGVDLGEGRFLVPTCYSLRNRNSQTHVLMNWHFEASNDKINWAILDRRIYLSDNLNYNLEMEEEQKQLCKKGATSTWGVDQSVYNELGTQGFRYFRIVQVGKNSSGSDNLTMSGFELYGRVVHNATWEF